MKIGIVGLPNVGKSTLFNAFLRRQQALTANYPFATVDPNVGVVDVIDKRVDKLADLYEKEKGIRPPVVYPNIEFVDIAGLVAGAHKGEGLGNQFLANIRNVDMILQVVRDFSDEKIIREHSKDPNSDTDDINTELIVKDIETLTRRISSIKNDIAKKDEFSILNLYLKHLSSQNFTYELRKKIGQKEYNECIRPLSLLTDKKMIYVFNVDENDQRMKKHPISEYKQNQCVFIDAKLESEISVLSLEEREKYLSEIGLTHPVLDQLIKLCFESLNLIIFLTIGDIESRAWTIKSNSTAIEAAERIHSDFRDNFIKAEVISYEDYIEFKSKNACRKAGKLRLEGKDYIVRDADVIEFKIGTR